MSNYVHRRGSIFWALTLIAVGGLFLYHNFNPAVRPWHLIAKWWPILIIFWGVSKLLDHLHARAHPETAPPPLFSASEVVLLVLILVMGSLVSKLVLRPWQEWPAAFGIDMDEDWGSLFLDPYTFTETLTQPVTAPGSLLLVVRRGDVEVHGSDGNAIEVVIKKQIRAENEEAARAISDQLKFKFAEQTGRWVFESNVDSVTPGRAGEGAGPVARRSLRLDLVLRVPKSFSTEITSDYGDVTLDELTGDQTLATRRGDVRVVNVEGLVRARTSRGSVTARGVRGNVEIEGRGRDIEVAGITGTVVVNGDFSGSLQLRDIAQTLRFKSSRTELNVQQLAGRLDMEVGWLEADDIEGPFDLNTRQKDITLSNFKHSVRIRNANGDVRLRTDTPPRQPVEVELSKGGIELIVPQNSSFQVDARSEHGDVECEFTGPELKVSREGRVPTLAGSVGKDGPAIRLNTSYGTIRVAHSAPTAMPRHARPRHAPELDLPEAPKPPEAPGPTTRRRTPAPQAARETAEAFTQATVRHLMRAGMTFGKFNETAARFWGQCIRPRAEALFR